jgi:hypothetical protein
VQEDFLSNSGIAELLAVAAETAKMPLQKALRKASRKAFMWEEEAALIVSQNGSLTELPGIGPSLDRIIREWIESPTSIPRPPAIRKGFLTVPEARAVVAKHPSWRARVTFRCTLDGAMAQDQSKTWREPHPTGATNTLP